MSTATSLAPSSIAEYAQSCLKVFQVAQDSFAKNNATADPVQAVTSASLVDESSRFRLWCGNIGAHRRGKSSLDHKLREASHIKDRVVELLQRNRFLVEEIDAIINGRKIPWDAQLQTDSEESEDELEDEEDASSTELQQLVSSIGELITNLMQLSSTIRNPAPHDQFRRSQNIDTSHFEEYDIQHVRGKYPRAEQFLVTRMGRAISRRRLYLRYREEHRARLAEGLDAAEVPAEQAEGTVASSIPPKLKSGASVSELEDDDDFDDHASQTSYASSMSGATTLRPPPLPKDGQDGRPFECPLCHYFTTIGQDVAWQKHVYGDLQPYVCTFEACTTPDRTYDSRREWFSHELQEHRRQWACYDGCSHQSLSQEEFQTHLRSAHNQTIADKTLRHAPQSREIHKNVHGGIECALCQMRCSTLKQLRSHLGKHQRELSLFALPSSVHEEDDEDGGSEDERSSSGSEADIQVSGLKSLHIDTDAANESGTHFSPVSPSPLVGRDSFSYFGSPFDNPVEPLAQDDDAPAIGGILSIQQLDQSPDIGVHRLAEDEHRVSEELGAQSENQREAEEDCDIPYDAGRTRIDRSLVSPRSLQIFGLEFEEDVDSTVVFQELAEQEIWALVDLTRRLRTNDEDGGMSDGGGLTSQWQNTGPSLSRPLGAHTSPGSSMAEDLEPSDDSNDKSVANSHGTVEILQHSKTSRRLDIDGAVGLESDGVPSLESRELNCPLCDAYFTGQHARRDRRKHLKSYHLLGGYFCDDPECAPVSTSREAWMKHRLEVHAELDDTSDQEVQTEQYLGGPDVPSPVALSETQNPTTILAEDKAQFYELRNTEEQSSEPQLVHQRSSQHQSQAGRAHADVEPTPAHEDEPTSPPPVGSESKGFSTPVKTAAPVACEHTFKVRASDATNPVYYCNVCYSQPHSSIYECSSCTLQACRLCASKV